jgi:hypothetical protein
MISVYELSGSYLSKDKTPHPFKRSLTDHPYTFTFVNSAQKSYERIVESVNKVSAETGPDCHIFVQYSWYAGVVFYSTPNTTIFSVPPVPVFQSDNAGDVAQHVYDHMKSVSKWYT